MTSFKKLGIFAFLFFILIAAAMAFDDFDWEYSFQSDFDNQYQFDSDFDDEFSFDSDFDDEFSFESDFDDSIEVIIDEPDFDNPIFEFEDDEFFFDDNPEGPEDYPFHKKVNNPPVITSYPGVVVYVGELYTYQVTAVDPDGDALTYHVDGPEGMTIATYDTHGMVRWTPAEAGEFDVKVIVTDNNWGLDAQTYKITVLEKSKPTPEPQETIKIGDLLITKLTIHNEYAQPGETIEISMNLENTGKKKLENIRVTASLQELAERSRAGPFDLKKREQITKRLFITIPEDTAKGEYYFRFSFSNNNIRRVKYRPITII